MLLTFQEQDKNLPFRLHIEIKPSPFCCISEETSTSVWLELEVLDLFSNFFLFLMFLDAVENIITDSFSFREGYVTVLEDFLFFLMWYKDFAKLDTKGYELSIKIRSYIFFPVSCGKVSIWCEVPFAATFTGMWVDSVVMVENIHMEDHAFQYFGLYEKTHEI